MCSNDSPSEIADGTTDAATLADEYEEFLLDIEEQPLPSYRTDEMRARIEEIRGTLAVEGVAAAGQLQQLLRTVTEALADVRAAQVVPAPEGRDLSQAVPGANDTGAEYEITETEQRKSMNVLLNLLFTVVETPTHEDRRQRENRQRENRRQHEGRAAREGDDSVRETDATGVETDATADAEADDTNTENGTDLGVTGYAGPE